MKERNFKLDSFKWLKEESLEDADDLFETLQREYSITAEDIRACIAFACDLEMKPEKGILSIVSIVSREIRVVRHAHPLVDFKRPRFCSLTTRFARFVSREPSGMVFRGCLVK